MCSSTKTCQLFNSFNIDLIKKVLIIYYVKCAKNTVMDKQGPYPHGPSGGRAFSKSGGKWGERMYKQGKV